MTKKNLVTGKFSSKIDVNCNFFILSTLCRDVECACYINQNEEQGYIHVIFLAIYEFYVKFLYNRECPEFTSQQQSTWAVLLGIFFGVFTALWGKIIEKCVETVWVTIPSWLLEQGFFTNLDGHLPLPHYMWIAPTIFGGVSSSCLVSMH